MSRQLKEAMKKDNLKNKVGRAPGPINVHVVFIIAKEKVEIQVIMELCQEMLDGLESPVKWAISVVVQTFRRKSML